jgi:hypothetical protein
VAYSEWCRDKLLQFKIGGQSKPFVDKNLQLQLPGCDSHNEETDHSHSPIYSHYVGSSPYSYISSQINEAELYHVMAEAEHSYDAWKDMQKRLKEAATAYKS